jgi:hypothetical protein
MMNLRLTLCVALLLGIATAQGGLRAQDAEKAQPLESELALGKLLFADVVSVHFTGPGHPATPDGSFGGLVADEHGGSIKLFEHYICREPAEVNGVSLRAFHAYDKLGKIEQRRAASAAIAELDPKAADGAQVIVPPAQSLLGYNDVYSPSTDDVQLIVPPEQTLPRQDAGPKSLAEQIQKAKDADANIVVALGHERSGGNVLGIDAERGIVHIKDREGFSMFVVLSKIDVLLLP